MDLYLVLLGAGGGELDVHTPTLIHDGADQLPLGAHEGGVHVGRNLQAHVCDGLLGAKRVQGKLCTEMR